MTRTWQDNADELGAISRGEFGWSLAVLVACSVEKQPNEIGKSHSVRSASSDAGTGKTSAREFAARAGVGSKTVDRYLSSWEKAVEAGAPVPPAEDLSPGDVGSFELPSRPFNGKGGYVSTSESSADDRSSWVANNPDSLADVLRKATPETLEAATDRLSREHRTKTATSVGRSSVKAAEAEAIANGGGRVSTPDEIRAKAHPSNPDLDAVATMLREWADVERKAEAYLAALRAYGPVIGDHADQVRSWSVQAVDVLANQDVTS